MPKRSSKKRADDQPLPPEPADVPVVPDESEQTTSGSVPDERPEGKNPAAVALGRLGGKKGGAARAAKLTKEQRQEIARKAAQARWHRERQG
jgi:hypothetical protein